MAMGKKTYRDRIEGRIMVDGGFAEWEGKDLRILLAH